MRKPQSVVKVFIALLLNSLLLINLQGNAAAQQQQPTPPTAAAAVAQSERERGVVLFKGGDTAGAIRAFREATKKNKLDADAWHSLGQALNFSGDFKGARKAFETALKLRPDFAPSHTGLAYTLLNTKPKDDGKNLNAVAREAERALALDSKNADAHYLRGVVYLRKNAYQRALDEADATLTSSADFAAAFLMRSQALLGIYQEYLRAPNQGIAAQTLEEEKQLRDLRLKKEGGYLKLSANSLEQYLKLSPKAEQANELREQLESLRAHAQIADRDKTDATRTVFSAAEVTEKAHVLAKPEAQYTKDARQAQITGTSILRAVLADDGKVKYILVIQSLPFGLTEAAVRAARQIKFTPATKDGRPVSQFIQIEYSFNLY